MPHIYETDGAAIYRQSFAMIRAEADLAPFFADEEPVAVRMMIAMVVLGVGMLIASVKVAWLQSCRKRLRWSQTRRTRECRGLRRQLV